MKLIFTCCLFFLSVEIFAQSYILDTDFQLGIPTNYSIVDNDFNAPNSQVANFTSAWIGTVDPEDSTNKVAAATSYFSLEDTASRWLITPALSLSSFGNFISWKAKSHDPSFPDNYMVLVSTTDNQISSFTDTIGDIEQENFEWTEREVNLSENGYNSQTIYVAFVNTTFDGYILYLDSVQARIEDPVGNIELQSISVKMYPNPTNDFCIIDCEKPIKSIKISDFNGRLISTLEEQTIDLRNYKSGIYFISLNIENQIITKRIVKL